MPLLNVYTQSSQLRHSNVMRFQVNQLDTYFDIALVDSLYLYWYSYTYNSIHLQSWCLFFFLWKNFSYQSSRIEEKSYQFVSTLDF